MSNRNLMHYFSPHATKPTEMMSCHGIPGDLPETSAKSVTKRTRTSKVRPVAVDDEDDDDFDDDSLFLPRTTQPGNSITKYFSQVDREDTTNKSKKKSKPCIMTVEAQVHGSPPKKGSKIHTVKKMQKKKKRKLGIPSAIADTIELISSEELVTTESSPSPEVMDAVQFSEPQPPTPKSEWKMKICLSSNVKVSDDDVEDCKIQEGPRRSTRVRVRPERIQNEPAEVECKNVPLKKRKKGEKKMKEDGDDLEIIAEDIAPIFLKKKWEDEARAMKKAKQEFLFSGVPEVLKQQTAALVALELRPVEIFPKISHVTQAGSKPWRLPYPDLLSRLLRKSHPHSKINRPTGFSSNLNSSNVDISSSSNRSISLKQASYLEWRYCKDWITRLKEDYSLSFPFFRTLRTLLPRTNKEDDGSQHLPWTDAYAPKHSNDILTNNRGSSIQIKNWLNQWKSRAGEEITALPKKKPKKVGKRKRISSDCTDSEEVVAEESSNASWNPEEQLCNCILLVGPAGCGKTATIYALAEELGYNVLEVNASSRRNGKTVLSHLHEATQSHSLNNNSNAVTNSLDKLFFGGGKSAVKASRPETKTALSLVLFEDVDIVFESEDESFYNALTTLIQTSKRPIVLTLGSTEERALTLIQDKIKSYFDIVYFLSPDPATACGYLWSVCLAEGYPVEWKALENWVGSRGVMNLDLRSLLLKLQFLLQSHPLRLKLNFSQLQLKNDEEGASSNGGRSWGSSSDSSDTIPVQLIELPLVETLSEWPYASAPRSLRFTYDTDSDAILMTDSKKKKRFSRILSNDSLVEPDAVEETIEVDEEPLSKAKDGNDLTHLARCMDLRAGKELFSSCLVRDDLSWNDACLLHEIQQLMTDRCSQLMEKDLGDVTRTSIENSLSDLRYNHVTKTANRVLLHCSVPRNVLLNHRSHSADVLPYLRSFVRVDLERSIAKRRRKPRSRMESSTTRLPTLDLVLSTSSAIHLANNF